MSELSSDKESAKNDKFLNKRILVCLPAYNEAINIHDVIEKAKEVCSEVVVYDDGSIDNTREMAESAGAVVIGRKTNRGYGAAIRELFKYARKRDADIIVTLDTDGQHDPSQIPLLLKPILDDESDIVVGSRFLSRSESRYIPRYRNFGIKTITRFARAASYRDITDAQSGFRAYSKEALSRIILYQNGMSVSTEILLRANENDLRVNEVPISVSYDMKRSSTSNPLKHGIEVLFSVIQYISLRRPLLFYGLPGIVLLLCATYFTTNALELFSSTRYISTNMIIISIGLAMAGLICLATGVIVYTLVALLRDKVRQDI